MATLSRNSDPDTKSLCNNTNVVFIDTNLDTHLALVVFDLDTVSDLKKRILSEHPLCFPKIGQIQIHAIKVKRKGYFYHLSDSMFVRSAFHGFNKSWFLSVDASALRERGENQQLSSPGSPNQVGCLGIVNNALIGPADNAINFQSKRVSSLNNFQLPQLENRQDEKEEIPLVSPCVSEHTGKEAVKSLETGVKSSGNKDTGIPLPGSISETQDYANHVLSSLHIECEVDGSSKGIKDDFNVCEEDPSRAVPSAKKKRKSKRKKEDAVQDDTSKENIASSDNPLSFPSKGVSSFNNFQVPQLENKQDEKEEIPFVSPCLSEHTVNEVVKNLETGVKSSGNNKPGIPLPGSIPETQKHSSLNHELQTSHIECEVDGSSKGIKDDCNVCEEDPSISVPSAKKKRKSKRKKEDRAQDDTSKENIASVDNLLSFPSKKESSFNKFPVPQLENKQDEKEEIPIVSPHVSEHTRKVVKNLETAVKSSGNNDLGIPVTGSIPETQDHSCVNHELPTSNIECEVDGSSKGIKDDCMVCEEGTSQPVPSAMKKRKSKRKKEDTLQDDTSKENDASVVIPGNDTVHQDIVVLANPSENADKEVIKETEVLKEHQHTECNNNNTKNDIDVESMKEASEPGPATNKKHRKRKRPLTHDSKEMLKVETTSQKDEACKERKELKDQFEFNNDKSSDDVEYKHNKVTEDVSDAKTPAKKKRKGKGKSGDESLPKDKLPMISDFNVDSASHHFLEDQQKIKNSSAEHFNDADPLGTNVLARRRKGKKNSSNPHETPVVTSSRKDDEADRSSIQEEGVREETSEDGPFSKDISMNKTTLDNMEIETNVCNEGIRSKIKRTGKYKNHCDIDMKVHPSDVNEPKELTEDNKNVVLHHCNKSETGQSAEGAEEGTEVSPQNDPKPMPLEECTISNQDNTHANIRELNVTSKVVGVNEITEPAKSEKKKRGIRKSTDSGGGPALREGIGLVDASESETIIVKSLKATNCDPTSGNIEIEENALNQTEGKNIRQEERKGTVLTATDKEDDFSADNAGSLEQIKTKANAEHVDKRQRKKSNHKQTSTSKSISSMLTKDQVLDSKKPSPSSDSGMHDSPSFKTTKESKSASTKSTNKSSKTNLEPEKYSVGLEPSDSRINSGNNGSSQFPSNTPEGSYKLEPFEANDAAKDSTHSSGDKDDDSLEAPSKTYKINDNQQFSPKQQQLEANLSDDMPVDKLNGADRTDIELMTGKNVHKLEVTKGQTHAESLSSSPRSSKEERDVLRIRPEKKVQSVHRTGQDAKLSSWSNSAVSSIGENRKPHVYVSEKRMDSEKRRERLPVSNLKLEGSKKMVQNKAGKAAGNNVGGVVSNTQQKKSLLAGAIFKDDSSSTSEDDDEDEVDNSDASTRTPSDNSLLSDFSDGDSNAGSSDGKRLENGERSALKACLSSTKGMSIDHILRSSSRYKKAKITASQLEETESQPIDFVPDSLADM